MNKDRLDWRDFFKELTLLTAKRSPDPQTQVGAVIVSSENKVVSTGYNGAPRGIHPNSIPWERTADSPEQTKYPYVIHAELNAILNSPCSVEGCTLYATLFPCIECMKAIIQSGIKELYYINEMSPSSGKFAEDWQNKLTRKLLQQAGIHFNVLR